MSVILFVSFAVFSCRVQQSYSPHLPSFSSRKSGSICCSVWCIWYLFWHRRGDTPTLMTRLILKLAPSEWVVRAMLHGGHLAAARAREDKNCTPRLLTQFDPRAATRSAWVQSETLFSLHRIHCRHICCIVSTVCLKLAPILKLLNWLNIYSQ